MGEEIVKRQSMFRQIFRMIKMAICRKYRGMSIKSILIWIFCIAYFVSPIDVVLDAVPFLGFIDDAAVLGWGVARFNKEFKKFKEWDEQQEPPTTN